jgi:DNA-nicking Smr family endonuclease
MRRKPNTPKAQPPAAAVFANQPFAALKPRGARQPERPAQKRAPHPPPAPRETVSDEDLFQRAMADVTPLPPARRAVRPAPPRSTPLAARPDETAEALAELCDLVSGDAPFDISHSSEFVEGCAAGVDARLLRRLRRGEFAYQSHLDLHGMSSAQARDAVDVFLRRAVRLGQRCVLIVHGRGLNSKDQVPVLKGRLTAWLGRGSWSRMVLAFTTARQCDGGLGALYVLLRRRRHDKKDIRVTEGARW